MPCKGDPRLDWLVAASRHFVTVYRRCRGADSWRALTLITLMWHQIRKTDTGPGGGARQAQVRVGTNIVTWRRDLIKHYCHMLPVIIILDNENMKIYCQFIYLPCTDTSNDMKRETCGENMCLKQMNKWYHAWVKTRLYLKQPYRKVYTRLSAWNAFSQG